MRFIHQPDRIFLPGADAAPLAQVDFPALDASTVNVTHTFVDDSLRGQGVAGQLMLALANDLRTSGKKAVLTCSYAARWFSAHPEFGDVVK